MVFAPLDIILILAYFILVILVAYFKTRNSSEEDFLIADRKLGIIASLSSINATKTGSIILVFTAFLYLYGFSAMWYFIGVSAGYLLFIPFAVRLYNEQGRTNYTQADYFFKKYGNFAGKFTSVLNILLMFAWLMLNLIASSKVLSFFTGLSFLTSTIIVAIFVMIYLLIGGFKAVVTTDVLQYAAIVIIFILFAFFLIQGTSISPSEWNIGKAGLQTILGFFLIGLLFPFASPDLWQRVYAVKNLDTLKKSIFYSVLVYIIVGFLIALVGLSVKSYFPSANPDIALIQGFAQLLPAGLSGLAIVIFFAAFMSSIDTYTYTASSSLVQDFFKSSSKKDIVKKIKISIFILILLASIVAVIIQDLVLGSYIFAGYAIILAIPVILTWIKPSVKKYTLNTSFILGILGLTYFIISKAIKNALEPSLVVIAIGISIAGLILGSIISKFKT